MFLLRTALLARGSLSLQAACAFTTTASSHHLHTTTTATAFVQPTGISSGGSNKALHQKRRLSVSPIPTAMATPAAGGDFTGREWKGSEAHEVLPKVFLGSMEAALDKESLKEHGVTHILTVNGKEPKFKDDFEYKVINFGGDKGGITQHLVDSLKFVEAGKEAGGVMIHCTHGTGRSASMAIAAAMKASGEGKPGGVGSFTEAFQLIKARRPGTDPPMPFQKELTEWEESQS